MQDTSNVTSDTAESPAAEAESAAKNSTHPKPTKAAKRKVSKTKGKMAAVDEATSLDEVMAQLNAQDEALKTLAAQAKSMLATNAAIKRSVRQVVKQAGKHDELTVELNRYRKKWANLQSVMG